MCFSLADRGPDLPNLSATKLKIFHISDKQKTTNLFLPHVFLKNAMVLSEIHTGAHDTALTNESRKNG